MTPREEEMIVFVAKREKEKYRRLTRARSKKKKTKKNRRFDSTRERSYSASLVFVARTAESLATPARDDDGF
jgi:dynactin complex subunit